MKNYYLVILTEGFNFNLVSNSVNNFTSCLNSMYLLPLITRPTRFPLENDGTNPSIFDHIWINSMVPYAQIFLCMDATDHSPVFMLFSWGSFENMENLTLDLFPAIITLVNKEKIRGEWDFSTDPKPILPPEFRCNLSFSLTRLVFNQKQFYYLILNLTKKIN